MLSSVSNIKRTTINKDHFEDRLVVLNYVCRNFKNILTEEKAFSLPECKMINLKS